MAWSYGFICMMDFVGFPILTMLYFYFTKTAYVPWSPLTLQGGGLYHVAMGAIVGVTAWTRGQLNVRRVEEGYVTEADCQTQQRTEFNAAPAPVESDQAVEIKKE